MRQVHLKTLWSIYSENHRTAVLTGGVSLDAFSEKTKLLGVFVGNGLIRPRVHTNEDERLPSKQCPIAIEPWLGNIHFGHRNGGRPQFNRRSVVQLRFKVDNPA